MLDSILGHYREIVSRAHGRREELVLGHEAMEGGIVQGIRGEDRRVLQKWFGSCAKGRPDRGLEPEVFAAITAVLAQFE